MPASTPPASIVYLSKRDYLNDRVFEIIAPYITTVKALVTFFNLNKELASFLNEHGSLIRNILIALATRLTAYPSKGFIPDRVAAVLGAIRDRTTFMHHVRALVCPWTNIEVRVPIPDLSTRLPINRFLNVLDSTNTLVISSPLTRDRYFAVVCDDEPAYTTTRIMLPPYPEFDEERRLEANTNAFFEEIQAQVRTPFDMDEFAGTVKEGQLYNYFPIHGAAFAVVSSFDGYDIDRMPEHGSGVYIFSLPECKMLSHRTWPVSAVQWRSFIQSRPFQLWVLTTERLFHMKVQQNFRVSTPGERIDPSMHFVARGDLENALSYMSDEIGCTDLDLPAKFNGRTMLHYAAMRGQGGVVDDLLEMGAQPFPLDYQSISPLQLAVRGLHHECVCLLACGMIIPVEVWNAAWCELCKGSTMKNCFKEKPEMVSDYCRTSIPDIVQILWNNRPPMDRWGEESWVGRATRSYTILSSKKALEFVLQLELSPGQPYPMNRFTSDGAFKTMMASTITPVHDNEMLDALRMAVRNFGLDINSRAGASQETYLIAAVRYGTANAVRVLIEELGADVTARSCTGIGIRDIAAARCQIRTNANFDQRMEAVKITEYIMRRYPTLL